MYQNWQSLSLTLNADGTLTARATGVQVNPQIDTQGAPYDVVGGSVEPTITDPAVLAQITSAVQAAAQSVATRDNARVRLNGSATEYVKPA